MQFPPLSLRSIYSRPTDSRPDMTLNSASEGPRSLSRQGSLASFLPRAQNRGTADPLDRRPRETKWESPPPSPPPAAGLKSLILFLTGVQIPTSSAPPAHNLRLLDGLRS